MNTINPFKATMSGKQHGKSIFGNKATTLYIDKHENTISNSTIYRFIEDPLAYLVLWHQNRDKMDLAQVTVGSPGFMLINLDQVTEQFPTLVELKQSHRDAAAAIRDYYKSKLVRLGLVGEHLTEFRKCLYDVVNNPNSVSGNKLGILCKLPEFYTEDLFMDQLLEHSENLPSDHINRPIDITFEYVGSIDRRTRYKKVRRYWFRSANGYLATFNADLGRNSALPVLEQYLVMGSHYLIRCESGNTMSLIGQDDLFRAYYLSNYDIKKIEP